MATKSPRINFTLEESTSILLTKMAERENKSVSSLVKELTLEALELREDLYLSNIAQELDQDNSKIYNHKQAWK